MKIGYTLFFILIAYLLQAQTYNLTGKITNTKIEAIGFAKIQVEGLPYETLSKEDGSYSLALYPNYYTIIVTLDGYKPYKFKVVIQKEAVQQNIILQPANELTDDIILIKGRYKDKAEDYIRNIIKKRKEIENAIEAYKTIVYIKATEINIDQRKAEKALAKAIKNNKPIDTANKAAQNMNMTEVQLLLETKLPNKTKETRNGIAKRGDPENLFYLTTTDGDFSLYNNLIKIKPLSVVPFLSPVSYSGLVAYKYKTKKITKVNGKNIYTISFRPTAMGNTLLTGELEVEDSVWAIRNAKFSLPKYHLTEYDNFNVDQEYALVNDTAWLLSKQVFTYDAKTGRSAKKSGSTKVFYKDYVLNPTFPKNYFGLEKSSATKEAYERDSSFWNTVRTEPLTLNEIKFINYKDSIKRVTTSKPYLDSIDAKTNKITFRKVVLDGLTFYNRAKERTIDIGSLLQMYNPAAFGGERWGYNAGFNKMYKNKKVIFGFANLDYGIRNKDVLGDARFGKLYNPFNRGRFNIVVGRNFDFLFPGDAITNVFLRKNVFKKTYATINHEVELKNGLYLGNELEFATRTSIENYKFANFDSSNRFSIINRLSASRNQPQAFATHNAFYNTIYLSFTPQQRYIREPYQKIILGSSWPTFTLKWKKGIPSVFGSDINYDYVELSARQTMVLGTAGVSRYNVLIGNFLNKKSILIADYKFMRGRDKWLFFNPEFHFQALDSTFAVFKNFVEGHYIHEFNGAILNKIPVLKMLQLREIAGGGILLAPERNLRYIEFFAGLESKPFRIYREKFKIGIFGVASFSNQFKNPAQIKISIRTFDFLRNIWN